MPLMCYVMQWNVCIFNDYLVFKHLSSRDSYNSRILFENKGWTFILVWTGFILVGGFIQWMCIYFSKGNSSCTVSSIQWMEVLTAGNWPCLSSLTVCLWTCSHLCACLYISASPQTDKCATAAFSPTQTWLLVRWELPNLPGNGGNAQGRKEEVIFISSSFTGGLKDSFLLHSLWGWITVPERHQSPWKAEFSTRRGGLTDARTNTFQIPVAYIHTHTHTHARRCAEQFSMRRGKERRKNKMGRGDAKSSVKMRWDKRNKLINETW